MRTLKELVAKCLQKDKPAWSEFVLRFRPLVERAVRARLHRHNFSHTIEDIKDITQGIFLDIWKNNKLALVKDEDRISGWLAIVSQNAAIDFIRSHAKFNRQDSFFFNDEGASHEIIPLLASAADPLKELIQDDFSLAVEKLIESLEPRERLILRLNLQHNKTHREIAKFMKIPINTVSSILRRTMLHFREVLRKHGHSDI